MGSNAMHSNSHTDIPRVTVIMAAYNSARFIRQSINSVLSQTLRDVELIVADDCSTDETQAVLASITDPRLRVLRNAQNLGVVESRNRCFAQARGAYVAMLDSDDLSRPRRLEKQAAYLDAHADTVLIGTAAHLLQTGKILPPRLPGATSPALIGWLLLVANPLVCSSVMFRAAAARPLDPFMRRTYTYAEDFDLYHRLKPFGAIARLDEPLTLYRLHDNNHSRKHEEVMTGNAVRVLEPLYVPWFGAEAPAAAALISGHLAAGRPVTSLLALRQLQDYLRRLTERFLADGVAEPDRLAIRAHAEGMWARILRQSARHGRFSIGRAESTLFGTRAASPAEVAGRLFERLPFQEPARLFVRSLLTRRASAPLPPPSLRVQDTMFEPALDNPADPPTLYVVVDTEAEFDWTRPFERGLVSVQAIEQVELGQAVFDRYGLRPIYVVDYPIATETRSIERLRAILHRGGCEIGAHLHPWTTPPFAEEVSSRNSYPGNLPPSLEREKLAQLMDVIETNFGVRPLFYKAGRYGFGPHTTAILAEAGIRVDLSVLPGADLRRDGGPDFRALKPRPYRIGGSLLTMPMTRSPVGLLPPLGALTEQWHRTPLLRLIPLQAAFSRTRLVDTITLTPEGVTAAEQIRLLRALLRRGTRQFVLHYHSPSLEAGHTSYTRTHADVLAFVRRLEAVCAYFFETVGGMPGFPRDLLG